MKKFSSFMKRGGLVACALLLAFALDFALAHSGWIRDSGYFWLDDFEITQRQHPEEVWERVIYGSSELTSGYREDLSRSGYVNMGMDYATIVDLVEILEGGHIQVGSELVLALNWGALCDTLETNPTYEWHRAWYEPYFYFQRDRIAGLVTDTFRALMGAGEFRAPQWLTQEKAYYYGHMTQAELEERVARLHELYLAGGVADFQENLAALAEVFAFCDDNGIRVRALWLPENPAVALDSVDVEVREAARQVCQDHGVEFYDMTDALAADCFYDTGHMEYEYGAVVFTEVLDPWLLS